MNIPDIDAHTHRRTTGGADIYVLDTGAAIGPEAVAMLQALHSRSIGGLQAHLKKLIVKGPAEFMKSFYVGYGHKSIGDCGTTTMFIEGISMLAAKAIQDWPLYSGQESSTRYLDFSQQPFMNPVGSAAGEDIQERWREFYLDLQEPVQRSLREQYPRQSDENEKVWEKAIKARAFDITRAFLPAGATTNVAWHTNLRQAADKLALLRNSPVQEVAVLGETTLDALMERYPSSFGHKTYPEQEQYNKNWLEAAYYFHDPETPNFEVTDDSVDRGELDAYDWIFRERPVKTELPRFLDELGRIQFSYTLDFGSFRDIQRQRAVTQRMPLLTDVLGFHPWYLAELPEDQRHQAWQLLNSLRCRTDELHANRFDRQYYIPMGYLTSNRLTGALPQLAYLVELRATRFVHPTLRERAVQMADVMKMRFGPYGLTLHLDDDPGRFDIRRGEHDITER